MVVDEGRTLADAVQRATQAGGLQRKPADIPLDALRAAIDEHRRLFRPQQVETLRTQRQLALDAMRSFAEFAPRLAGSLVYGDGPLDRVRLLLNVDTPEQVMLRLSDLHIPWRDAEVTLNYAGRRRVSHPAFRFQAGDATVELVALAPRDQRQAPREAIDQSPLTLLDAGQLETLLSTDD